MALQAMFVLEVTRSYPGWAEYSDENSLYASPEGMITRLRRWVLCWSMGLTRQVWGRDLVRPGCCSLAAQPWLVSCGLSSSEVLSQAAQAK